MTNQHLIFYLSMMMVYVGIRTIFFSSEQEAINYAEKCNAKTADYERWDYCKHNRWILTQHIEAKSS
ncbi:hypothetical protein DWS27_25875 [Escherichia coli]|nr:hypothetical protein [Escherichia coli]